MLEFARLVTVHPALVHFTIGAVPLLLVAYGIAAIRRSAAWTFVGDAAAVTTAVLTLFTFVFGLVSNAVVRWPGGLDTWRWLHLAFGALSTLLLVSLAGYRLVQRRRSLVSDLGTLLAAVGASLCILVTGWIGGEVLVFHAGMAVKGGAGGALAPPVLGGPRTPTDLADAMNRVRASWGSATGRTADMIVHGPTPGDYMVLLSDAQRLRALAAWIAVEGPKTLPAQSPPSGGPASTELTPAAQLSLLAGVFGGSAEELEAAAQGQDLKSCARVLGEMGSLCAGCHASIRFGERAGAPAKGARR